MHQCFSWIDNKEIGEHAWSTGIAYILWQDGHVYLCPVVVWHSR
jgi:hypothetical protein